MGAQVTLLTDFRVSAARERRRPAVAVVIGVAFGALVTALVRDLLTLDHPALIFGKQTSPRSPSRSTTATFAYGTSSTT